jgi:hypothetical protein
MVEMSAAPGPDFPVDEQRHTLMDMPHSTTGEGVEMMRRLALSHYRVT